MRRLNAKQKKMLTKLFEENGVTYVGMLNENQFNEIRNVNPHECCYQNANRFLQDRVFDSRLKGCTNAN